METLSAIDSHMSDFDGQAYCIGSRLVLGHGQAALTRHPFSFIFPRGALTAVVGPNGAGKTTLLRAILGEEALLSGAIRLFSLQIDVKQLLPKELARYVAFVPQEHSFPPDATLNQLLQLAYLPRMGLFGRLPAESDREICELLSLFSLEKLQHRPLKSLSTGERQKAFLGRALLQRPRLLILDEPTNHLDPGAVHAFWTLLLSRREKCPLDILVSTHDLSFVRAHCEWVCALKEGELFFNGPNHEFFEAQRPAELFGIPWEGVGPMAARTSRALPFWNELSD